MTRPMLPHLVGRFWDKVDLSSECWTWTGAIEGGGYGLAYLGIHDGKRRYTSAHRAAWMLIHGDIDDGLVVDHLCRNRACVRPDHLEPVPQKVNVARGTQHSDLCPRGHEYDTTATHADGHVYRRCRTCNRDAARQRRRTPMHPAATAAR